MLRKALIGRDSETTVLISPLREYGARELLRTFAERDRAAISNSKIGLQLADVADGVTAIAAVEGLAEEIIIFSPSHSSETVEELASKAGARHLVSRDTVAGIPLNRLDVPAAPTGKTGGRDGVDTSYVLATSGTTGTPKLVSHSFGSLTRTTRTSATETPPRWGLLYDYTRFAGFQVLLQALVGGGTLIAPDLQSPLREQLEFLTANGCTHLSATPTMWRKIMLTPNELKLKQITLGGEIADDKILTAVAERYPGAKVTHIFASTEAGAGFSVRDGRAGFPVDFLTNPPWGIDLDIREGRLFIKNTKVAPSYVGTSDAFGRPDGFIDTGDSVEIRNGRVLFLGRENGVINVGGNKVFPEKVEAVIAAHPAVRFARVLAKKNPLTGSLVMAQVIATDEAPKGELQDEIAAWCKARLERHEVPAFIQFVDDFELNSSGKITRR